MIPKKIHYCWFGGKPLNKLGKKCLKSWKKYFPDYEIIEWNENNFDLDCCPYVREAYKAGKWAFVSDYVRYKVLYEQGGLYFDTDVEVIAPFDDILQYGAFLGCENPDLDGKMAVNPGIGMATEPGSEFYKEMLEEYQSSSFCNEDGSMNLYTIVDRTTDMLKRHGLQDSMEIQKIGDIVIYPAQYFCPINMNTGKLEITPNTHSIHRYSASWVDPYSRFRGKVYRFSRRVFGEKFANRLRAAVGRKNK